MNRPTPPSDPAPPLELIETTAAAWLSLRDRGLSPAQTAELVSWLQQDQRHAETFAALDQIWRNLDRLGSATLPVATPNADLLAPRLRARRHRGLAWTALAAAAAIVVAFMAVGHFRAPQHAAETGVGEFKKIDLPDGSVAQLNTDTAIDIDFKSGERRVRIVRGEAFFSVIKDPACPFIVMTGSVAVRAVGTAFNVRQLANSVEVLVTEGRVRLDDTAQGHSLLPSSSSTSEPPLLVAGERAVVALHGSTSAAKNATASVEKVAPLATQRALAWQERRLEFDSVQLADVVSEFNRYNRTQLVIDAPALAAKRFSGNFRSDGFETLVRLLENDFGVTTVRGEHEIVLKVRH